MNKIYCFCLLFLFCFSGFSQDFSVKGILVDSIANEPLEAATVHAELEKDSSLVSYTITDKNGFFNLEGKTSFKRLRVIFSYNGYKQKVKVLQVDKNIDLGKVPLQLQPKQLKGVDVMADRVPITIKRDTLEFNADSFKTRPDATVEDVLKKLPGVEIDSEGKIMVNGKEVNQVLVNGQIFFSKDPKVATKSLPKEIISKIQITDTKTKEQEFTGDQGDGENKTINLTLKKEKSKGLMGRLSGGYGTDERYQANGLLNYFNNTERISMLGSSNNINNSGFSFDEIYEMVGNARGGGISFDRTGAFSIGNLSFGFGKGITTSSTLGASYANQKKNSYELDGNYFFSYSDSFNDEKIARENILPDRSFFTDTETNFTGSTSSNQGAASLEFDIDSTMRITAQPRLSINRTNSKNIESTTSTDEDGTLINRNNSMIADDGFQRSFSNELEVMKKLDTLGRYVRLSFKNDNALNSSESTLISLREIFGDNAAQENLNQQTITENATDGFEIGAKYRHPIKKDFFLDFEYAYEHKKQKSERSVFGFDEQLAQYVIFNESLSSDFEFDTKQHAPSIALRLNSKKVRFNLRANYYQIDLKNEDFLQRTSFSTDFKEVLFRAWFNYMMEKNKRLSINYFTNLNIPSVNQLQPVPNVSNPLNIVIGNPNLSPETYHNINLGFNNFNWKERTGFFLYSGLNVQKDKITSITTTDENLLRTTTFNNVKGNYNGWAGVNYSKQIKKDSLYTLKVTINPYLNYSRAVSFANGARLESKTFSFFPRLGLIFNLKEQLEVEPSYTYGWNKTRYNVENISDVAFKTHNFSIKTTSYWPENVIWGNDLVYTYNGNLAEGFDKDAIFWNMSLGLQLFKKKGSFKILAYDLLNQNINTRRTTGQDFVQDFQGTVLNRYFMASFTLKFDSFGGSGPPKRQGGPRFIRL